MRKLIHGLTVCGVLLGVGIARPLMAQPFTLNDKIKPTEIKLEPYRTQGGQADGRIYAAVITQTQEAQYFFVQGISIYSPDYVGIASDDPSARIQISLHKETWDQPSLRGQTDASGHWDAKFRTTGDFGIRVAPNHVPAAYTILVWVGNEIDAPLPSPFRRSGTHERNEQSSGRAGLYAIAGLLVVAIAAGRSFKLKAARMWLLVAILASGPLFTQAALAQGGYPKAVEEMLKQLKSFLQLQESAEKFWQALKGLSADEALPDDSQRGPALPSSCVDGTWKMGTDGARNCQCMTTAVDKLRKNRQMLEKLRIYVVNQKVFVDKATALGNSYAQLHTMLGLQWVGIRKHDIEEPYAQFKITANQKHQLLMAAIQKDLQDISDCEAKLGEPDWYSKYGFMYYEFLYAAYKPSF